VIYKRGLGTRDETRRETEIAQIDGVFDNMLAS